MDQKAEPQSGRAQQQTPTYRAFPQTAIDGASDQRCHDGKPEDRKRDMVERKFGGKVK